MARLRHRIRRVLVGLGSAAIMLSGIGVLGVFGGYAWLRTSSGNVFLEHRVESIVTDATNGGRLEVGALHTNLFDRVELEDVVLYDVDGTEVVRARRAAIQIQLGPLVSKKVALDAAVLEGVEIDLVIGEDGKLNVARLFAPETPSTEPWAGLGDWILDIPLQGRGVDLRIANQDRTILHLSGAQLDAQIDGVGARVDIRDIAAGGMLQAPGPSAFRGFGTAAYTPDGVELGDLHVELPHTHVVLDGNIGLVEETKLDLVASVHALGLQGIDPLAGNVGLAGNLVGEVTAFGPLSALDIGVRLDEQNGGAVFGTGHLDLASEDLLWSADATLEGIDVQRFYPSSGEVLLDGELSIKGTGLAWPDDLHAAGTFTGNTTQSIAGYDFDDLVFDFGVDDGRLDIDRLTFDGILGQLYAVGDLDLVGGPLDLVVSGRVDLARLEDIDVPGLRGRGTLNLSVVGDIRDPERGYSGRGHLFARNFRYGNDVTFAQLSTDFQWAVAGKAVSVDLSADGSGAELYGATFARVVATPVAYRRQESGDATIVGEARAAGGAYGELIALDRLSTQFNVDQPKNAPQEVGAIVDLGRHTLLGQFRGDAGDIRVQMSGSDLQFKVDLDERGRDLLTTSGNYDLSDGDVVLRALAAAPTPRVTWIGRGTQTLRVLPDGGIGDARIAVLSPLGKLDIDGTLARSGELDGTVKIRDFSLDVLAELFPERASGLHGDLELEMLVTGDAADPDIVGRIDARRVWAFDSVRWLDVIGDFRSAEGGIDLDLALGSAGDELGRARGLVPVNLDLSGPGLDLDGDLDVHVAITPGAMDRLPRVLKAMDGRIPSGRLSAGGNITGPLRNPNFDLAGIVEIDVDGWTERGRVEFNLVREDEDIAWTSNLREGYFRAGEFNGRGKTRLGKVFDHYIAGGPAVDLGDYSIFVDDMDVAVALLGVPAPSLAAATGSQVPVGGELYGGFSVMGSPVTPIVMGAVNWLDASIGEQLLDGAYAELLPTARGYQVGLQVAFDDPDFNPIGSLEVQGSVPVAVDLRKEVSGWAAGEIDLTIGGDGLPLEVLAAVSEGIQAPQGTLMVGGTVSGTVADPAFDIAATMTGASFTYEPLGLLLRDVELDFQATDQLLKLRRLQALTFPGKLGGRGKITSLDKSRLNMRGQAHLEDWTVAKVRSTIELDDAYVQATPEVLMRLNGDLKVSGDYPELKIRLSNEDQPLEVLEGKIVRDSASFADLSPLSPDSALTIHRGRQDEALTIAGEDWSMLDFIDVDLDVLLLRNLEVEALMPFVDDFGALGAAVTSADFSARIGSEDPVRLRITGGDTALIGDVEILDGKVSVFQSRFSLDSGGLIHFLGDGNITNPTLELDATMNTGAAEVAMRVRGTADEPEVEFSSPQYADQTAILTILLTGRAPEDLTSNQGAFAYEALGGLFLSSVFANANFGSLAFDPDGTLRFGTPITQRVYAEFMVKPIQDLDDNRAAASLEWSVAPRLVTEFGLGDRITWTDAFWEYRF